MRCECLTHRAVVHLSLELNFLWLFFPSLSLFPLESVQGGTFVEFFNPKHRRELEKKDEELKKSGSLKGSLPGM